MTTPAATPLAVTRRVFRRVLMNHESSVQMQLPNTAHQSFFPAVVFGAGVTPPIPDVVVSGSNLHGDTSFFS